MQSDGFPFPDLNPLGAERTPPPGVHAAQRAQVHRPPPTLLAGPRFDVALQRRSDELDALVAEVEGYLAGGALPADAFVTTVRKLLQGEEAIAPMDAVTLLALAAVRLAEANRAAG